MSKKWILPSILSLGLVTAIAITPISALAERALQVLVNGSPMNQELQPKKIDDETYVLLAPLAEELGAKVTWDKDTNAVSIQTSDAQTLAKQVKLLQQTLLASTPEQAAQKYAEGVKTRNGAVQYSMLTPNLQEQKKSTFEEMGWVTGVSSPWVEKYTINKGTQVSEGQWKFTVSYVYNTSDNEPSTEEEHMTIIKVKDHWYVSKIE